MILAPHILAGAALASQTPNPALGLILAYATHYLFDALPHAEYDIDKLKYLPTKNFKRAFPTAIKVIADFTFGFAVIGFLAIKSGYPLWLILAGGFLGVAADSFTFVRMILPVKILPLELEKKLASKMHFSKNKKYHPALGYLTQILVGSAAIASIWFGF